ncbi:MAG: hypothetical protein KKB21_02060 [Nanoarchaeota archaeon]|nr:hypothetical protein [Nanoarchaeota archaeon]MBU4086339.1 hypothetical protein [Nanoarchaeota archaeon]
MKEHQRKWAYALQKEFHLEKDSAWRYGQRIIGDMIADDTYKKTENPGLLID